MNEQQSDGNFGHVLLPTDGNDGAETAVEYALEYARAHDAELTVLYAIDPSVTTRIAGSDPASVVDDEPDAILLDALEERGQQVVDDLVERAVEAGVATVDGTVEYGQPHRVILDYADERDVDLIVMGTHGRTGLDRYLVGSVTEKVVRGSGVPVLTVRMPDVET